MNPRRIAVLVTNFSDIAHAQQWLIDTFPIVKDYKWKVTERILVSGRWHFHFVTNDNSERIQAYEFHGYIKSPDYQSLEDIVRLRIR